MLIFDSQGNMGQSVKRVPFQLNTGCITLSLNLVCQLAILISSEHDIKEGSPCRLPSFASSYQMHSMGSVSDGYVRKSQEDLGNHWHLEHLSITWKGNESSDVHQKNKIRFTLLDSYFLKSWQCWSQVHHLKAVPPTAWGTALPPTTGPSAFALTAESLPPWMDI